MKKNNNLKQNLMISLGLVVAIVLTGFISGKRSYTTTENAPQGVFSQSYFDMKDSVLTTIDHFWNQHKVWRHQLIYFDIDTYHEHQIETTKLKHQLEFQSTKLKELLYAIQQTDASRWPADSTRIVKVLSDHQLARKNLKSEIQSLDQYL